MFEPACFPCMCLYIIFIIFIFSTTFFFVFFIPQYSYLTYNSSQTQSLQ